MIRLLVFRYLDTIWSPHTCDRFASYKVQLNSCRFSHQSCSCIGSDGLKQRKQFHKCSFETITQNNVKKIESQKAVATVIAPEWTAMQWCSKLRNLSVCAPIRLPKAKLFCRHVGLQTPEPLRNKKWRWFPWRVSGYCEGIDFKGRRNLPLVKV